MHHVSSPMPVIQQLSIVEYCRGPERQASNWLAVVEIQPFGRRPQFCTYIERYPKSLWQSQDFLTQTSVSPFSSINLP